MTRFNPSASRAQYTVEFVADDDVMLKCPRCGTDEGYLHHGGVTVYSREEDGPVTVTTINGGAAGENPSARRDGIAIRFTCELCPAELELTIAQHKGHTHLMWRSVQ
jgi:hypothetical protein